MRSRSRKRKDDWYTYLAFNTFVLKPNLFAWSNTLY